LGRRDEGEGETRRDKRDEVNGAVRKRKRRRKRKRKRKMRARWRW